VPPELASTIIDRCDKSQSDRSDSGKLWLTSHGAPAIENGVPLLVQAVHGARLIIAKLDRLARNVAFVPNLMESGVDFEAVDFPQANRLTIHILAAVAEHEARMISERTKAALAAAKARGVKLGGDHGGRLTAKERRVGIQIRQARAAAKAADLAPVIAELRAAGVTTLRGIAGAFNSRGIPTARGEGVWDATRVSRVLARLP
jgi:DNA invertase Pin-like site-specific DNA recombinase